jgi:hypothetical protein
MTADNASPKLDDSPELNLLRQQLIDSGALGRSAVYINLLDYLLQCAREGRQPKEFEIAIDVLNRDSNFDVTRDSVVRVNIHQLRKRLDTYFDTINPDSPLRLQIPKGQYTVIVKSNELGLEAKPAKPSTTRRPHSLYAVIIALLLVNVWQWFYESGSNNAEFARTLAAPMWAAMQDDDIPILIVMGDYYIFGELDDNGRVSRMVRDFMINSRQDLVNLFMQDTSLQNYFRDLDMTYMPEGSASALLQIAPLVSAMGKRVNVTMMSRLSASDLRSNHIIYIGYISAMDKLNNLYFSASGLLPGRSFDEIYDKESGVYYTSNAGLPEQGQPFQDLALIASWPAANDNQFVLLSGTRDAGLMHAALVASDSKRLSLLDDTNIALRNSFEALYEVYGVDRMNFDASLLYHKTINSDLIWARE